MICLDLIGLVIICILWLFAEQDFYDWLETTGEFVIGCMVGATDRFEPAKDAWHQKILKMQHR